MATTGILMCDVSTRALYIIYFHWYRARGEIGTRRIRVYSRVAVTFELICVLPLKFVYVSKWVGLVVEAIFRPPSTLSYRGEFSVVFYHFFSVTPSNPRVSQRLMYFLFFVTCYTCSAWLPPTVTGYFPNTCLLKCGFSAAHARPKFISSTKNRVRNRTTTHIV